MMRYNKNIVKKYIRSILIALGALLAIKILLIAINISLDARYPLRHALSDQTILDNSHKLYQRPTGDSYVPVPGNDSYPKALYTISPKAVRALKTNQRPLAMCKPATLGCTPAPIWRPRSTFFKNQKPIFTVDALPKPIARMYVSMADSADTLCTAYDYSPKEQLKYQYTQNRIPPNYHLLCYSPALHVLSYEYVSDNDSKEN